MLKRPKHRFIVWLAVHDRLLTKERMQRLNTPIGNTYCCLCDKQAQETNKHLLWQCKYIKAVKQGLET